VINPTDRFYVQPFVVYLSSLIGILRAHCPDRTEK
jgi:hypothetical protein